MIYYAYLRCLKTQYCQKKLFTDHVNHPSTSDNDVILSSTTVEDPILPSQSPQP